MSEPLILKKATFRPVPFATSKVDILIPFHGQYEKVFALVTSILAATRSNPYHITLIDDHSSNDVFAKEINEQFIKSTPMGIKPQVSCIRTGKQLGFGGALFEGYKVTQNPWVVIMHSDCLIEDPNWMTEMGQSLLNWKQSKMPVKIVSARSDNPGDFDPRLKGKKGEPLAKDVVVDKIPLYCAMCNRQLFHAIKGFIKAYPYAWYEDEELAYRMKKCGFLQGVSAKSWVHHEGEATIKELDPQAREIMEQNRTRCIQDMKQLR